MQVHTYRPTYTANPVADAAAFHDRQADIGDAVEQAQHEAAAEIRATFSAMVGVPYLDTLALPCTDYSGWKEERQKLDDAVAEMICDPAPWVALAGLLRAKPGEVDVSLDLLRKALAERYVEIHADEVGSLRAAVGGRA